MSALALCRSPPPWPWLPLAPLVWHSRFADGASRPRSSAEMRSSGRNIHVKHRPSLPPSEGRFLRGSVETDLSVSTGAGANAGNSVLKLVDSAGFNQTINLGTATTLYTAPAAATVKGSNSPPIAVPEPSSFASGRLGRAAHGASDAQAGPSTFLSDPSIFARFFRPEIDLAAVGASRHNTALFWPAQWTLFGFGRQCFKGRPARTALVTDDSPKSSKEC